MIDTVYNGKYVLFHRGKCGGDRTTRADCRRGNMVFHRHETALESIIAVMFALHSARLVLGWVTAFRQKKTVTLLNHPPRPTQPGHPFVGNRNEYWRWLTATARERLWRRRTSDLVIMAPGTSSSFYLLTYLLTHRVVS